MFFNDSRCFLNDLFNHRFIVALDMEGKITCYDRHFLLPVYDVESIEQCVLYQLDTNMNQTLTVDKDENDSRSIVMRSFMGNGLV